MHKIVRIEDKQKLLLINDNVLSKASFISSKYYLFLIITKRMKPSRLSIPPALMSRSLSLQLSSSIFVVYIICTQPLCIALTVLTYKAPQTLNYYKC